VDIGKRWNTSFFYNAAAGNQNPHFPEHLLECRGEVLGEV
jgi:hypothetical protein